MLDSATCDTNANVKRNLLCPESEYLHYTDRCGVFALHGMVARQPPGVSGVLFQSNCYMSACSQLFVNGCSFVRVRRNRVNDTTAYTCKTEYQAKSRVICERGYLDSSSIAVETT